MSIDIEAAFAINNSEKNSSVEGGDFLPPPIIPEFPDIESGLAFMLSHLSEPLFPRKVSTAATRGEQKTAFDKGHTMTFFQGALREDCRISAFYIGQTNPDLIFIDIDAQNFKSMRSFKLALTKTLKNIKEKIGGTPTIIWSGRGYHVIQPIALPFPLENIRELAELEPIKASNKFLQFCESYLSGNKYDKANHPALKSCMLRVPGSLNSRCKEVGIPAEVKIIQRWDGYIP